MQEDGLVARRRKRFTHTTMSDHGLPVAANLLDRQFEAKAPNQRWVGDTTEFAIGSSGKLYLAATRICLSLRIGRRGRFLTTSDIGPDSPLDKKKGPSL
jgi:transposase InsO family protein